MRLLILFISFLWLVPINFQEYHFGNQIAVQELGETEFYQIGDFKIENDRIYITDTKAVWVYAFDTSGHMINSSGREGRGPGEFVHGPRWLVPANDKVYVIGGMRPFLFHYDNQLNLLEHKKLKINPINTSDLKYYDEKLFLVTNQYFKEDLFIYNPADESIEKIDLKFQIEPGMLSKRNLMKINNKWLFMWDFQNKFKVYDNNFNEINSFSIDGLPDKAEGDVVKSNFTPEEATAYRAKVYKAGSFYPDGTFFSSFVKLDERYFMAQLGTLTGGSNKALIVDLEGNIMQKVTLPQSQSRILGYSNDTLYMISKDNGTISAYEFANK